jgi:hypothetical protein
MIVIPVTLPPGRERLVARPNPTGSPPITKTMGMVDVATLAAIAEGAPPVVTSTATGRRTRSAAKSGNRSNRPSANR